MSDTSFFDALSKLTPLIIGIGITGAGTWATTQLKEKEVQLAQIRALNEFRPLLLSTSPAECQFAYAAFVAMEFDQLLFKLIETSQDPCSRPALETLAASTDGGTQTQAREALKALPIKVFSHIAADVQKGAAAKFGKLIDQVEGYKVQGVENVGGNAPDKAEIRYFNQGDRGAADIVAKKYRESNPGAADPVVKQLPLQAKPGTVEVWMPREAAPTP